MMKRSYIVIFLLLSMIGVSKASQLELRIGEIRKIYAGIQKKLSDFRQEKRLLMEFSVEGGEAVAFRDRNGETPLIRITMFGETFKAVGEYFFSNNHVVFIYSKIERYNAPLYLNAKQAKKLGTEPYDPKKSSYKENRYYFYKNQLIRWIGPEAKFISNQLPEYTKAEKDQLNFAYALRNKFRMDQ